MCLTIKNTLSNLYDFEQICQKCITETPNVSCGILMYDDLNVTIIIKISCKLCLVCMTGLILVLYCAYIRDDDDDVTFI